jgi:ribonuclease BN (tRNA processing enzyme)
MKLLLVIGLCSTIVLDFSSYSPPASRAAGDSTVVVLLGTGTPVPDPRAAGASTAILVGERLFIVDAGAGVERRLSAAGLSNTDFEAVFFTHLHSDHTLGYPDLIFTSWVFGRSKPLRVFGPTGLQAMTNHVIAAFAVDIDTRTNGYERAIPNGFRVRARDVKPGVIYDSAGVRVTAIPVLHGTMQAYGYKFDTPGRSIVVSGDTRESEAITRAAQGVDVLVHEVVVLSALGEAPPHAFGGDIQRYMSSFHTPDKKLGELAARANPKLLLLTHVIPSGVADSAVIAGIRSGGYKGKIAIGHDLERF